MSEAQTGTGTNTKTTRKPRTKAQKQTSQAKAKATREANRLAKLPLSTIQPTPERAAGMRQRAAAER